MKAFIKALNWLEWISAGIGILILLSGAIQLVFGKAIFPVNNISTIFLGASTFFLLTIVLFLFIHMGQFKKE